MFYNALEDFTHVPLVTRIGFVYILYKYVIH